MNTRKKQSISLNEKNFEDFPLSVLIKKMWKGLVDFCNFVHDISSSSRAQYFKRFICLCNFHNFVMNLYCGKK